MKYKVSRYRQVKQYINCDGHYLVVFNLSKPAFIMLQSSGQSTLMEDFIVRANIS